jgi:periplasmic divalent cation tolerance protein
MESVVLLYTTWPSIVEAERAGRALVERRLAACVNILPGMISHYRWQGQIERAEEAVMIVKTRASLAAAVSAAVKELHSYETPAIVTLPAGDVDPAYHTWIIEETSSTVSSSAKADDPVSNEKA